MIQQGTTKIGLITDLHHRDDIPQQHWTIFDHQYRQFNTAEVRLTSAVDQANTSGCGVFAQLGDLFDSHNEGYVGGDQNADIAARLDDCLTITDTFNGDGIAFTVGNHERNGYNAVADDLSDYWTAVENSHNHFSRKNIFTVLGNETGYTFDYNQLRFVVMDGRFGNNVSQTQMDWLYKGDGTGVLETPLSCVIFNHAVIYVDETINNQTYDSISNSEVMQALFEAAGNVLLTASGHYHRNDVVGHANSENALVNNINGVVYLNLRGSILGADDGDSSDTATLADSAHYVVEIEDLSDVTKKATITVTGYKQGTPGSAVTTKTQHLIG